MRKPRSWHPARIPKRRMYMGKNRPVSGSRCATRGDRFFGAPLRAAAIRSRSWCRRSSSTLDASRGHPRNMAQVPGHGVQPGASDSPGRGRPARIRNAEIGSIRGCRCRCRCPRSRIGDFGCQNSRLPVRKYSWYGEGFSTPSCRDHTRRKPKHTYLNHNKMRFPCRVDWGALLRRMCWARVYSRDLRTPWRGRGRRGSGGVACCVVPGTAI